MNKKEGDVMFDFYSVRTVNFQRILSTPLLQTLSEINLMKLRSVKIEKVVGYNGDNK